MNDIIKQKVNELTLKAYLDFLKNNTNYALLYNDKTNNSLPNYTIKPVNELLSSEIPIKNLLEIHIENFDIYHKKFSHPFKNKDNHCDLFVWDNIQKDFYMFYKSLFDEKHIPYFYAINTRIIPIENSLRFLKDNNSIEQFCEQFVAVKYPTMFLQSNKSFSNTIDLLNWNKLNLEVINKILFTYCNNNKLLFKRIECQNILHELVQQYSLNENLSKFYPDIHTNSKESLFSSCPSLSLYINKKSAFSTYYNPELNDKFKLTNIFIYIVGWLNNQSNAPELNIKNIYIQNTGDPFKEYIISISFTCVKQIDDVVEVLDYLIHHLAHNKRPTEFSTLLPKFYFNYLLQKKIPNKLFNTNNSSKKI